MSSKKLNYSNTRHNKKPKISNSDTEVFVLPPNLLEKLGINLGSIESTEECPTDPGKNKEIETINNGSYHTIPEEIPEKMLPKSNDNGNESSFLETADLMKKSVFLSPTFNPVVNVISDEVELTESNNFTDCTHADVELMSENNITLECITNSSEKKDTITSFVDQKINEPLKETNLEPRIVLLDHENAHVIENYHENKRSTKYSDDFIGGAYSMDGSNSNFESFNSNSIKQVKPKQKINIISQEVPDSTQLKEIKNLFIPLKHTFIPVSMDTIITGKKYDNSIMPDKNTLYLQNIEVFSDVKAKISPSIELPAENLNIKSVNDLDITYKPLNTSESSATDHLVSITNPIKNTESFQIEQVSDTLREGIDYENTTIYNNYVNDNYSNIIKHVLETSENENRNEGNEQKRLLDLAAESIMCGQDNVFNNTTDSLTKENISESLLFRPETDISLPNQKNKENCCMDVNINNNINIYKIPNPENTPFINSSLMNNSGTILIQSNLTDTKDQMNSIEKDNMDLNNSALIYPHTMNIESISPINENLYNTLITDVETEKGDDNLEIYSNNNSSVSLISSGAFTESLSDNVEKNDNYDISENRQATNSDKPLDVPEDKVKEIAMYLKQLSQCSEQNKQKSKRLLTPKRQIMSSKLCVQGVEEPGGRDRYEIKFDNHKVYKKYKRSSINKPNIISSRPSRNPVVSSFISTYKSRNVEIDSAINMVNTKTQEFCLCHDFGRLAYYDNEVSYEHLHFWCHTNVNCEIETLFDIYNDNKEHFDDHKDDLTYLENIDNNSETDFNICWHVSKCRLEEYVVDEVEVENIVKYNDYNTNNDNKVLPAKDSPNNLESYVRGLLTKCQSMQEHDMNVDFDNNSADNDAIGENTGIEIVVEIKDNINEPLNIFSENLKPNTDYGIEENVNSNTDIMDVTINPSVAITAETPGETVEVEIMSGNKATSRKSDVDDKIEENVSTNTDVMDVTINPSACTTAETSGEIVVIEIKSDNKATSRKRKMSSKDCIIERRNKKNVKCSVCGLVLADSEWQDHVSNVHCYVAWKDGQNMNFEDPELLVNLKKELKKRKTLKCTFCDVDFKYLKKFLQHVQKCMITKVSPSTNDKSTKADSVSTGSVEQVKCGVCQQVVNCTKWIEHISKEHHYLAWKDGEQPLDLQDETAMRKHLYNIVQNHGALLCSKCDLIRNYTRTSIKYYLTHIQTCGLDESREVCSNDVQTDEVKPESSITIKCAVCKDSMKSSEWFEHLSKNHDYLAWKEGEDCPDLKDENSKWQHLLNISKEAGGLVCGKCGLNRKYPKAFLQHIKFCEVDNCAASASDDDTSNIHVPNNVVEEKVPKCAVCNQVVVTSTWLDHIAKEHSYMAWKEGETPLDLNDNDDIRQHLSNIVREVGKLICPKCGIGRKYPKSYLEHIKDCTEQSEPANDSTTSLNCTVKSEADQTNTEDTLNTCVVTNVECAVCHQQLPSNQWIDHSQESHNYAAWRTDEPPLDVNNEYIMSDHLKNIVKEFGNIICNKCSRKFKYVKTYMQHVQYCTGLKDEVTKPKPYVTIGTPISHDGFIVCGVCEKIMRLNRWMNHIQTTHNYLAWKDGQLALDLNNPDVVHSYLQGIINKSEGLICSKCGTTHVDAALYLEHVKSCKGDTNYDPNVGTSDTLELEKKGLYKCAICSESVSFDKWRNHAMDEHYNVAWVCGDEPVDLKSPYGTAKNMKEYLNYAGQFACKTCGITRVSGMGFYAHIIVCGKTEAEVEKFQNRCEICDSKYLCIYKSQHMTMHAQKELAKEQKLKSEKNRDNEIKRQIEERIQPTERRKAAQKAQSVIQDYNKSMSEFKYSCHSCAFGTDVKEQLDDHECAKKSRRMSDALSLNLSESSDDDLTDSDDDASADEIEPVRKKKRRDSRAMPKLPFTVANNKQYLLQGFLELTKRLYSSETLFPQWRICKHESVPEDKVSKYMPRLEQSCKLSGFSEETTTFERFQVKKQEDALAMFVGASIQCISWVPPHLTEGGRNYLAVAAHAGADGPRYGLDELVEHAALIQIWDFGNFDKTTPTLALGLAHDYGTVWAMDWCPSGARNCLPQTESKDCLFSRMGLLSVACSNGCGYIFSVPYPWSIKESDKLFYKLKPVVKLKFSMNTDRKMYQASSICWSKENGHDIVIVGYANGTTAFYDLNTESPFLRAVEDEVIVLYPYYDERTHTTCITALSMYPSVAESARGAASVGALGAASASGVSAAPAAGAVLPRARSAINGPCVGATFAPGWPGLLPAGDDAIMNMSTNELDYTGYGRRVGLLRACCGCELCGHIATHSGPYVRVMRTHPVYADIKRQTIAIIKMKSLGKKRKLVNDDLAIKAEPLRYEDAILRYGLHISIVDKRKRYAGNKPLQHHKEICPDRFPLADVCSMAFCLSKEHHTRLAIATYAGFIFVVNV